MDARGAHGLLTGKVEPVDKGCGVTLQVAGNADVWLAIKITPDASSILKGSSPIYWMLSPGGFFKWRSTGACFTKPDQLVTVTYSALTPLPGAPLLDPALLTAAEVLWSWLGNVPSPIVQLITVAVSPTGTPADIQRILEFGERMNSLALASMRAFEARIDGRACNVQRLPGRWRASLTRSYLVFALQACIVPSDLLCAIGAAFVAVLDTRFEVETFKYSLYAPQQIRSIVEAITELSAVGIDALYTSE